MSTKKLNIAAMKLPPRHRAKLAEQLLASLDDDAQRNADTEWAREAEERIDAFDSEKIRSRSVGKVISNLKRRKRR
jgi:putative addiction module component (TIGR02574 family)